jgi:dihydroflavonol-4-reductase
MKKVLLTGADGLLGSNLCRELVSRSYSVTALVEKGKSHDTIADIKGVQLVEGDILDKESLNSIAKGHDYLIHAAAHTGIHPARNELVRRVNIEGTQNMIAAALNAGIQRSVFVGTANSFEPGNKSKPGDETGRYRGDKYKTDYMDSKYEAYLLVKDAVKNKGLNAVNVHPTFMLGPYDSKPSSGQMLLALSEGKVPGYTAGGRNYICVKDAAKGIANALIAGKAGESYILGNENLSYKEAFSRFAELLHVKRPALFIPKPAVLLFGRLNEWVENAFGKPAKITKAMTRISLDEHYYSSQKAVKEIDLPQTPIEEGVKECMQWFEENGYAKRES